MTRKIMLSLIVAGAVARAFLSAMNKPTENHNDGLIAWAEAHHRVAIEQAARATKAENTLTLIRNEAAVNAGRCKYCKIVAQLADEALGQPQGETQEGQK
jgi:hypothetical protein